MFTEPFHPDMTLKEAAEIVLQHMIDGKAIDCPLCFKSVKVQTVSMDNLKIRLLASFANDCPTDWMERKRISKIWLRHGIIDSEHAAIGDGTFAKCAYWGLIEEQPISSTAKTKKKNSGIWRMTQKGHDFVVGDLAIRPAMRRYNGDFIEWVEKRPEAYVYELSGEYFDFIETVSSKPLTSF